ncbi:hypothetical protein ACT3TZ_10050 [Brachybacterium sp. AOP25-B2-12]|uniref:hypothetical protein n=1 Tax=Brachybacterium sp. AOP25-B2-12 TaxID=3457710 RepID=UPI004034F4CB
MSLLLPYLMLAAGGILLGGTWSFFRQKKPLWTVIVLAVLAVLCIAVALWRINQG